MKGWFLTLSVLLCSCSAQNNEPRGEVGGDLGTDLSVDVTVPDLRAPSDGSPSRDMSDAGPDGPVTVETTGGAVVGESEGGLATFVGIPYAAPPVGERRWTSPVPTSWAEPFEATSFGPRCPQPNIAFTSLQGEEDCLKLNVWTRLDGEPRPVMVWFHGGSFVQGASLEKTYRGHDLALHDVVVVTANYRLGSLGFLSHGSLPDRNFGLQDQLAVLDWVQENAAAFGGDPNNVTVFGESAGGISACLHIASGQDDGRFVRAITQSGPCTGLLPLPDVAEADAQGDALAAAIECDGAADVLACMRGADVEVVVTSLGFRAGVIFGDGAAWVPVRDDDLVPLDVEASLANSTTPMLTGGNADEGSLVLVGVNSGVIEIDYAAATLQMFGAEVDTVRAQYPLANYATDADAVAVIVSDRFVCGTRRVARLRADAGHSVFLYHFTHPFITPIGDLGAMHGAELPFVFGTELVLVTLRDEQLPLSERMQRYWTRFASDGDPNHPADPSWPAYSTDTDEHLVLDLQSTTGTALRTATCDFWDTLDDAN